MNVSVLTVTNNLALLIDGAIRGDIDRGWWIMLAVDLLLVALLLVALEYGEGRDMITKGL